MLLNASSIVLIPLNKLYYSMNLHLMARANQPKGVSFFLYFETLALLARVSTAFVGNA
jgi:hypothetical protein